eukprot:GHVT01101374.1.p1 GENE.GHVT01101374.1~~GHVT01101374.1.p1  ORF type:complete len:192 (-),score=39.21 GHVT01101374.1:714-1289(-)
MGFGSVPWTVPRPACAARLSFPHVCRLRRGARSVGPFEGGGAWGRQGMSGGSQATGGGQTGMGRDPPAAAAAAAGAGRASTAAASDACARPARVSARLHATYFDGDHLRRPGAHEPPLFQDSAAPAFEEFARRSRAYQGNSEEEKRKGDLVQAVAGLTLTAIFFFVVVDIMRTIKWVQRTQTGSRSPIGRY